MSHSASKRFTPKGIGHCDEATRTSSPGNTVASAQQLHREMMAGQLHSYIYTPDAMGVMVHLPLSK